MQAGPRKDEKTKKGGIVGWFSRIISKEKGEPTLPLPEEDEMVELESKRQDKPQKEKKHASHKKDGEHKHKHKHKHDKKEKKEEKHKKPHRHKGEITDDTSSFLADTSTVTDASLAGGVSLKQDRAIQLTLVPMAGIEAKDDKVAVKDDKTPEQAEPESGFDPQALNARATEVVSALEVQHSATINYLAEHDPGALHAREMILRRNSRTQVLDGEGTDGYGLHGRQAPAHHRVAPVTGFEWEITTLEQEVKRMDVEEEQKAKKEKPTLT